MKITKKILENIIKEEIASILQEHEQFTDKDMSNYKPKSTTMEIPEMSFGEKVRKALGIQSSGDKRLEQWRAYVASPEGQADEAYHRESEAWWQNQGKNQGKSQGQIDFERDQDRRRWAKQDKEKERANRMMKMSVEREAEEEYRRKYNNPDNDYFGNIGKI